MLFSISNITLFKDLVVHYLTIRNRYPGLKYFAFKSLGRQSCIRVGAHSNVKSAARTSFCDLLADASWQASLSLIPII